MMTIHNLRTERLANSRGIVIPRPAFTWERVWPGGKTLDIVIPSGCRAELSMHQRQSVTLASGHHTIR